MQGPTDPQRFLDGLGEKIRKLSTCHQLAFAASICERYFPNYLSFYRDEHWGDPVPLREALDMAWAVSLEQRALPMQGLEELLARCTRAIPDTENFLSASVSYALDVGCMAAHLVEFMANCERKAIVQIAALARDSIDAKVQEIEGLNAGRAEIEARIASHPLMISEIRRLESTLRELGSIRIVDGLADFVRAAVRQSHKRD
jgi:uncharacterized protein YjaG (DUF416 family)